MLPVVVVATKGRSAWLPSLVANLSKQTILPHCVVVVGSVESDVDSLSDITGQPGPIVRVVISPTPGSCSQRNFGLALSHQLLDAAQDFFVVFFDDDFRPAPTWLEECQRAFQSDPTIMAITGQVLADGAHGTSISEQDAEAYIAGRIPPNRHWASGGNIRPVGSVYGCNMAFRKKVVETYQFDENLPLYGWQEDQDLTAQAKKLGSAIYVPQCRGVHLGISSGKSPGIKVGYSQIANPLYLLKKGTMPPKKAWLFMTKNFTANAVKSFSYSGTRVDYSGRLKGNALAIADALRGKCHPTNILKLRSQ
jgi:GT2 family glycosyltransferase